MNDVFDILLHFWPRHVTNWRLPFLFLCYNAIYTRSFVRLTLSFFRFCSRRILESTCCPRICIQGRRFTNATFARETTRNHFGQISRKNFAPICWKCTVTRFLRLATPTTTLSGFLKSIGARISSTSRINRVRSFASPMERWKFTTRHVRLKIGKRRPATVHFGTPRQRLSNISFGSTIARGSIVELSPMHPA